MLHKEYLSLDLCECIAIPHGSTNTPICKQ